MRSIAAPMQNEIKYSIEDKYIFKKPNNNNSS